MEIDGVNPQSAHGRGLANLHRPDQEAEEGPEETPESNGASEPTPVATESSVDGTNDTTDAKGVLRLLEEGHFKGVADVRLRINFVEKLAAIEAAKVQAVAGEKVNEVLDSVGGVVDSFLADNELTDEQIAGVQGHQETFEQAVNAFQSDPVADWNNAFDEFVEALQNLFVVVIETVEQPPATVDDGDGEAGEGAPTVDGSGVEGAAVEAADGGGDEVPDAPLAVELGPDWETFIADLQSAFLAAMDELNNGLSAVNVLPELSEPSGNGVAYDKFLAIYNEMRGIEPADEGSDETEGPDSLA